MKKQLLITLILIHFIAFPQASIVKDITVGSAIQNDAEIVAYGNRVMFPATDFGIGTEPFISDGTSAGTFLVKDISPGGFTTYPKDFFYRNSNDRVYFSAERLTNGTDYELFISNGTSAGTNMVHEFNTAGSSNPAGFVNYNFRVYFAADATNIGRELCYTNGTLLTTGCIDIRPGGSTSGSYPKFLTKFNGTLFFSALTTDGRELWKSNGSQGTTSLVKDINPSSGSSSPQNFTEFNNKLYFTADDGTNGVELWETDGTTAGTQIVTDFYPGSTGSNPQSLTVYKNKLYFSADSPTYGREIFSMSTSNNILLHRDVQLNSGSSNPLELIVSNNLLFFKADDGVNGYELWSTNGTILGVNLVKDINPTGSSAMENFTIYNGELYFTANDGVNGDELWITDGTTNGTQMIVDINPTGSSDPKFLTVAGDLLFFHADNGTNGRELWKYKDPTLTTEDTNLVDHKIYPNPTSDNFTIESAKPIQKITIMNALGKTVKTFISSQNYNIEDLNSGVYFVKIDIVNASTTIKLIKK